MKTKPIQEVYTEFQTAYDFFNRELFGNQLPDCLITYQRRAKTKGYFADGRFENIENGKIIDEIAMNPDYFRGENITPKTVLSTLVHEMCHLWQKYYGKPSRNRYHNQEWAEIMLKVGLHPTSDGTLTGKMTGDKISHLIIPGGTFNQKCDKLLQEIKIAWVDRWTGGVQQIKSQQKNKTKYVCPVCHLNIWGKPDIHVLCGTCMCELIKE